MSPVDSETARTVVSNRTRFLEVLGREGAAAVVTAGSTKVRNADSEYRFRPSSDFFWLTGFAEPDSVLVLAPANDEVRSVLFLREKNRVEEIWSGRRLGVEAAPETLGVDVAYPIDELWKRLPGLLRGHGTIVYRKGEQEPFDRDLIQAVHRLRSRSKGGAIVPSQWVDPSEWLHELRLKKSEAELALLRRAAAITAEAHVAAMGATAPGKNEAEIHALLEYTFLKNGSTGPAYTNIVAGGANACILHYVENDRALEDGDLLLVDAGAEWCFYASDVTRTWPVNGTFSPEQRALYEVVLAAQKAAIEHGGPGVPFAEVHGVAVERLVRGLVDLGLLEGPVDQAIEDESYDRFYMHRTGHWLGLDVHDCGGYFRSGESRALEPGMVMTVEPGLYVAEDDETVEPRWRGIGIRIEDDVLITADGREVLTRAIPKEVDDVEAACRGATLQTSA